MAKRKIILDVDTGSDDAVAIMAAILSEDIDLVALCTVWGNLDIDHTTDNTLRLVEAMGMGGKIPVYKGCHTAMVKYLYNDRVEDSHLDGSGAKVAVDENGNEVHMHEPELALPPTTLKPEEQNAVSFYIDYLRNATEKVTLVPVGPLTNLGHALRIAPDIVKNIEEIVIMGGGDRQGNVTGSAEANIWHDPEAAEIVATCGAERIVWVPLDATHSACLTLDDCNRFKELGTFAGDFAAELTAHRIVVHNYTQPLEIPDAAAVHDALCICYLIDPTVLDDLRPEHIHVSFGDWGDGETVIDRRDFNRPAPNGWFAYHGDRVKFANILCDLFKKK